ncbi:MULTISPECIES: ring-cleaving dioxygenase [Bacillus]|uniref:ring-cleaving dioxygenase n=1 Tax=Bacillus TaxID=1386 RepID=UPI0006172F9D|nr:MULTISPECIES: ring-cleaving dioxygenase [Bacillus]KKB74990.1 ring-cleaving dioxygenase [Bacillus sp. TH008]MBU8784961.1 ring-cleaving dioxygenase [Bacillus glycinifermentans]MDU0071067.1 ring-cleaving dioxygenase [Bacillus sp. IG6]MED8018935.1 ring-cleaving dioxygenase [Bacillus glycinifermentans]NUJ15136.1 ring-cleaving dioxygenase [Bacillus glycinifermentans]
MKTKGLHHVTAFARDPKVNLSFYTEVLGLRLVKKTVNFDDPGTYHFYFGNETGDPGTILTFFPFQGSMKGTVGNGQAGRIDLAVPKGALPFWKKRLADLGIDVRETVLFKENVLLFQDAEDLQLSITEDGESGQNTREAAGIPTHYAITGTKGVTLNSYRPEATIRFLEEQFGYRKAGEDGDYVRLEIGGTIGNRLDVKVNGQTRGIGGYGTIHHVAFRTTREEQQEWKKLLQESGFSASEILDRQYFTSIYFREQGGILFEMATDEPGFLVDEGLADLGTSLKLPDWLEQHRRQIEGVLPKWE